jgi:hypothetical protein
VRLRPHKKRMEKEATMVGIWKRRAEGFICLMAKDKTYKATVIRLAVMIFFLFMS